MELNQVKSVYSGINGRCCCGCSGKHTDSTDNPRTVKMIFNKIQNAENREDGSGHIAAYIGKRIYVAYS